MPDGTTSVVADQKVDTVITDTTKTDATTQTTQTTQKTEATDVKPAWPDNWRDQISTDEKARKTLDRFDSPKALWESYASLRQQRDSGELKRAVPFPDKGTPEEQTQWRIENGIPEAPEKYDLKFDNGLVIGDDDKPIIDDFLKHAHAKNMPSATAKAAVEWYYKTLDDKRKAAEEVFEQSKTKTEDALRTEWGNDYHRNKNVIGGLLGQYVGDEELRGLIDRAVQTHPGYARFMAQVALAINPQATVVGAGPTTEASVADELATIKNMMGNSNSEYWKGAKAEKLQARYRELIAYQERQKK